MSLRDVLLNDAHKGQVVDDCVQLIDEEVKDKGGISGMAIKAGYKTVQGLKPGFVKNVVRDLLPEFADVLEPMYAEAKAAGTPIGQYFTANKARVADALLTITDGKAERSTNSVVKGAYKRLRGAAKSNVEAAVPRLGALIYKYA